MLVNRAALGVCVLLLTAGAGIAAPSTRLETLEKLDSVPPGWYVGEAAPAPYQRIKLQIALQQEHKHALLEEGLLSISTLGQPD
jgi:hypothetical protein